MDTENPTAQEPQSFWQAKLCATRLQANLADHRVVEHGLEKGLRGDLTPYRPCAPAREAGRMAIHPIVALMAWDSTRIQGVT